MRSAAVIAALARADLLERVRRYSFLVALAFVLWIGSGTFDGSVSVNLHDTQGIPNAAWVGGMMTIVAITFLSLAGFWIVKNAVDRDEQTGVGSILATTPMSRLEYTLGKALSHLCVLGSMVAILAACGIVLLLTRGGGTAGALDAGTFLAPFVFCAIPAFALTAALAILFETTPGLRGGAANALWLGVWATLLMLSLSTTSPLFDPWGIRIIQRSMAEAARAQLGVDPMQFSVEWNPGMAHTALPTFLWNGVAWTPAILLSRLAWLGVAIGIAAFAAVPFHRFDPARRSLRVTLPRAHGAKRPVAVRSARPLLSRLPRGMVGSELRLLLGGAPRAWSLVAAGLILAGWIVPLGVAHSGILLAAWIWPLLRWSSLGARDARHGTEAFILSAPRSLTRQLPAAWMAGVLLTAAMGSGVGVRLALAGDLAGVAAWTGAVLFIPALALVLGLISRGTRLFEVLYTILWYVGPANRTPSLDFMGATGAGNPWTWYAATALALATAFAVRARQLRG